MIIWFGGGLGNQLFQYALLRSAQEKGYDAKADLSYYDIYNCHNGYELKKIFNIDIPVCNEIEIREFQHRYSVFARAIRKLWGRSFDIDKNIIREDKGKYIENLISDNNRNSYLWGYWQSEKYFENVKDSVISTLSFPNLSAHNSEVVKKIHNSTSTSIHIRRGDYAGDKNFNNLALSNYYNNSIKFMNQTFTDVNYFVFSDDPEWCKDNLELSLYNTTYVTWNTSDKSYQDMHLMSLCKNNIIANSSFSWWGAKLNSNPNKVVIAPQYWYSKNSEFNGDNIVPKEWVRL